MRIRTTGDVINAMYNHKIAVLVMIIFFSGDVSSDILIPFAAASASYVASAIIAYKFNEQ